MTRRALTVLTTVNILVLVLAIAFGGAGRTIAQTVQNVVVTNTSSSPVPVDLVAHPFVFNGTITFPPSSVAAQQTSFTAPNSGCLEITNFSYQAGYQPRTLEITSTGSLGTSTSFYEVGSDANLGANIPLTLWISPAATVTIEATPSVGGAGGSLNVNIQGEERACTSSTVTLIRVASATAHRSGRTLTFRWKTEIRSDIAGFLLYAGTHRLTPHLIPVTRAHSYTHRVVWTGNGPYTVHVVLRDGSVMVVPARVK